MKRRCGISLIWLLGIVLSACAASGTLTQTTPTSTATQPPPQPTIPATWTPRPLPIPTTRPIELAADVLAVYHKRGCIQGFDETLIVHLDGTLNFVDTRGATKQSHIEPDQLTDLQQLLAQPEFDQVQPLYQAMGADLCVYTLTTRRAGQPFTVTTMDSADHPEVLTRLVKELERLRDLAALR